MKKLCATVRIDWPVSVWLAACQQETVKTNGMTLLRSHVRFPWKAWVTLRKKPGEQARTPRS